MDTNRVVFLKPTKSDYVELLSVHRNEQVRKYLGGADSKVEFDRKFDGYLCMKEPNVYWVLRLKETGDFLGMTSITYEESKGFHELSYQFMPEFWGQGYGTEVLESLIEYAFGQIGFEELYAETQKKNTASIRLLKKIGMEFIGEVVRYGEEQMLFVIRNVRSNS